MFGFFLKKPGCQCANITLWMSGGLVSMHESWKGKYFLVLVVGKKEAFLSYLV